MKESLYNLNPDVFDACMRLWNLSTFIRMNPDYQFKPGQYPYIDEAPPAAPITEIEATP